VAHPISRPRRDYPRCGRPKPRAMTVAPMTRHRLRLLVALALAHAIEAAPARAEAQEDHAAARTIGGTTFVLPALADSAFVLTEFGFRQGINYRHDVYFRRGRGRARGDETIRGRRCLVYRA
jgi:hypothetical protein